jgi:hypothetical protein
VWVAGIIAGPEFHGCDAEPFQLLQDVVERKLGKQRSEYADSQMNLLIRDDWKARQQDINRPSARFVLGFGDGLAVRRRRAAAVSGCDLSEVELGRTNYVRNRIRLSSPKGN